MSVKKCNKCSNKMEYLGNVSGMVYTSNPVQWDDVYVCHKCKEKITIREHGELPLDTSFLNNYPEQIIN